MVSKFVSLYEPYVNFFRKEYNFGWWHAVNLYAECGNSPGIYPDVGMLLEKAVARPEIQTVVEMGSGMSTLILAMACDRHGKDLISLEEKAEYTEKTESLLTKAGLPPGKLLTVSDPLKITKKQGSFVINLDDSELVLESAPDLIFYDCVGENRPTVIKKSKSFFKESKMVIADDMENKDFFIPVMEILFSVGKKNCQLFNPIGREDRTVCIATANKDEYLNQWIWEWRPDKVFW